MSSYFPMTGFRSTVCASTVDNFALLIHMYMLILAPKLFVFTLHYNRYDCVPTRWGLWADTAHLFILQFIMLTPTVASFC